MFLKHHEHTLSQFLPQSEWKQQKKTRNCHSVFNWINFDWTWCQMSTNPFYTQQKWAICRAYAHAASSSSRMQINQEWKIEQCQHSHTHKQLHAFVVWLFILGVCVCLSPSVFGCIAYTAMCAAGGQIENRRQRKIWKHLIVFIFFLKVKSWPKMTDINKFIRQMYYTHTHTVLYYMA